jgi:hypothetical protein
MKNAKTIKAKVKPPAVSEKPRADMLVASLLAPFSPVQEIFINKAGFLAIKMRKVLWIAELGDFCGLFPRHVVKLGQA